QALLLGRRFDRLRDLLDRPLRQARIDAADFAGATAPSGLTHVSAFVAPAPAADHISLANGDVLGVRREERVAKDVIVSGGPEAVVVVFRGPEHVVEDVVVGGGQEHGPEPADESAMVETAPLVEPAMAVVVVAVACAERPAHRGELSTGRAVAGVWLRQM